METSRRTMPLARGINKATELDVPVCRNWSAQPLCPLKQFPVSLKRLLLLKSRDHGVFGHGFHCRFGPWRFRLSGFVLAESAFPICTPVGELSKRSHVLGACIGRISFLPSLFFLNQFVLQFWVRESRANFATIWKSYFRQFKWICLLLVLTIR